MSRWDDTVAVFSKVTDTLGKKIDPGIFETVVCLNLLGITTRQSCEGHMDWGLPYPWVDLQQEEEKRYSLYQLISQFYEGKQVHCQRVLVFHGYRMQSAGAIFSDLLPTDEKEQSLRLYQAEMSEFTSFLKYLLSVQIWAK